VCEALWVRKLLLDFEYVNSAITLRGDNQGAITLAKDFKASAATKHVATAYHLTRDYIAQGAIELSYVTSAQMIADRMTKAQGKINHQENCIMNAMVLME